MSRICTVPAHNILSDVGDYCGGHSLSPEQGWAGPSSLEPNRLELAHGRAVGCAEVRGFSLRCVTAHTVAIASLAKKKKKKKY
mmetsp:Transcript_37130/g.74952  ORF Transcript_37130/g.74952 Transcript_37130/m.74952 type:complete len:83 (-) Transcript_37130:14-262(-)